MIRNPVKMQPFVGGLVAGFLPIVLAWTSVHEQQSGGPRRSLHSPSAVVGSIALFAGGGLAGGSRISLG